MMQWRLSEVARVASGELVGGDASFDSVSTDTRTLKPGALFVALSGENEQFRFGWMNSVLAGCKDQTRRRQEVLHAATSKPSAL